jgi:ATP-binding cassette subfamily B protein
MLKTLTEQIKQYKKVSFLAPLFAILEVITETLIPIVMSSIIDQGISAGNTKHVYLCGVVMMALALVSLLFGVLAGKYAASASTGFACNLRDGMFENIQTFAFSNIDKYSTAGLVTRLTTDVTNVQNSYQMIVRMCARAPFTLIFALTMSIIISPKLSMIFVVAILFLGGCLTFITLKAYGSFSAVFKKYDDLNASVQENVSAIRVVKAFVREDYEKNKFKTAVDNVYRLFVKAETIVSFNNPIMMISIYGCVLALSWLGAKMITVGDLTTGQLTSLFSYIMNIMISLMMISMAFVMISMSIASARRIAEVLSENADIKNPKNPVKTVEDGSIAFENVSFSYMKDSNRPVLSHIDLKIASGETIGIIGSTGSSKTSLVNLISRLYDVDEGTIYVGGKDVRCYDIETLRNEVAVVLQKNVLFSGTILDNLRWGNKDATLEDCVRVCKMACADEFIERMPEKYDTFIEQGGSNVSGGQKQRLCIARALLKKPKVLILDDSTSAVDTATDAKIRTAFREEIPDTTKLIIAQRISSVAHADRILVMDNGLISGFDTHENLLKNNEIYRDVYMSQTKGSGDFDENGGEA